MPKRKRKVRKFNVGQVYVRNGSVIVIHRVINGVAVPKWLYRSWDNYFPKAGKNLMEIKTVPRHWKRVYPPERKRRRKDKGTFVKFEAVVMKERQFKFD